VPTYDARQIELAQRRLRQLEAQRFHFARQRAEYISSLHAKLSAKQLALRLDQAKDIVTVCTRQSGKTSDILLEALERTAYKPTAIVYAVLPTRERARDTLWDRWKALVAPLGCDDDSHNETRLETRIPGGGIVRFVGAPDIKRADRIRGQVLDALLIDEASNFPEHVLKYLVEDCAIAALGVKKGVLRIYATPGPQPEGYLYRLYTDKQFGFSRHFLTLFDNPAWDDPAGYLAKIKRTFGYKDDDPTFLREWMGQWVADLEMRVYRLTDANLEDEVCTDFDYTVLAVDLGATDESAIAVLGWKAGSKVLRQLHDEADDELDLTSVAERVKALQEKYRPIASMVDGAAKQSVLELQNRHGIALEATPKAPGYKVRAVNQWNADAKRGFIKVPKDMEVGKQMRALQWKKQARGVIENPGQPNDRCDAHLYAYLKAVHFLELDAPPPLVEGSEAWWREEARKAREAHERANAPQNTLDPWNGVAHNDPWKR
jgi:hypothetical protein